MDGYQHLTQDNQRFESDIKRLTRKHLSDPNHVITDEELASVRVGMTSPPDATTQQAIQDAADRISEHKANSA